MTNKNFARDMARGVFEILHWTGYALNEDGDTLEDIYVDWVRDEDYDAVIDRITEAIEGWLRDADLPPGADPVELGEDLALPDSLSFTTRYGDEFEHLHDSFPSAEVSFWYEGDQLRAELDSVWMQAPL